MRMSTAADALEPVSLSNELVPASERLSVSRKQSGRVPTRASCSSPLVENARRGWIGVLCQLDGTANLVEWDFAELYYDQMEARASRGCSPRKRQYGGPQAIAGPGSA
jgi:hypothetical protein